MENFWKGMNLSHPISILMILTTINVVIHFSQQSMTTLHRITPHQKLTALFRIIICVGECWLLTFAASTVRTTHSSSLFLHPFIRTSYQGLQLTRNTSRPVSSLVDLLTPRVVECWLQNVMEPACVNASHLSTNQCCVSHFVTAATLKITDRIPF